ncbi:type 1 fimbrial protein [Serratia sp. UGAL515B_01]|nr:type 1 fimbrial protein [Serratia sp. UGAL515B_01]
MNSLRLFLIAGALFSWTAASQAGTTSGTITFVGGIVESPCVVSVVNSTANTECYRNGKNHTASQPIASYNSNSKELPQNVGTTEIKWLDQQKKTGIMTVAYR